MSEPTHNAAAPTLLLEPPEMLHPVAPDQAPDMVPLDVGTRSKVDQQVDRFIEALLGEPNVETDGFKSKVDAAFRLGREEISSAANLMTGRFMERNFVGMEDSAAFKAIQDMRGHLDELNPGKEGDLLSANKLLGMIPWGNKLQAYFRKYQTAGSQLKTAMEQLYAARDDMQRDAIEIETHGEAVGVDAEARRRDPLRAGARPQARGEGRRAQGHRPDPRPGAGTGGAVLRAAEPAGHADAAGGLRQRLPRARRAEEDRPRDDQRLQPRGHHRHERARGGADGGARHRQPDPGHGDAPGRVRHHRQPHLRDRPPARPARREDRRVRAATRMLGIEKLKEMFDQTFKAMDAMDNFRSRPST